MSIEAQLIDYSGDDLMVVNAARVSFDKESNQADYILKGLSDKDARLINYLVAHGHWTPFAHPQITLRVKAPVSIRTQCFKHKQGFVENEISRRYVDDTPEFFYPVLRQRPTDGAKQGSRDEFPVNLEKCDSLVAGLYSAAKMVYETLIDEGVAPEQARFILPQGMMTEWYWTGSLAAYARFYDQRTDLHAQKEIQDLAKMIGKIIEPLYPVSWKALTNG